jgi:hypothetical protein
VLVIVLDDANEHVIEGVSLPAYVDFGRSNTYGTELRAQWGEAHVHHRGNALYLCASEIFEGCGDVSRRLHGIWRSDDGGRTWARDSGAPHLSDESIVAAATTHPSTPPFRVG